MLKTRLGIHPAAVARSALAAATLLPALLTGCTAPRPVASDAGRVDARRVAQRTLVAQSETNVALVPSTESRIRVLLRDDASGVALANETVRFALEGNPRGSTLRALEAVTDATGIAEAIVVAGTTSTTFTIRASASDAPAIAFSVSVGGAFGTLRLEVDPQHAVSVDSYLARVALGSSCAAFEPAAVVATRTLTAEFAETEFVNLATDATWAVDVRGVTREGVVVASGCTDALRVRSGETTTALVSVTDRALEFSPRYEVSLSFDAREGTGGAARRLVSMETDAIASASLLLDALEAELASRLLVEPRARLRAARVAGLDARVSAQLLSRETSFVRELSALASEAESALSSTTLEGTLVLSPARLEFAGGSLGEGAFAMALPTAVLSLSKAAGDVTLNGVTIELRASTLWLTALQHEAARADSPFLGGPLCEQLAALTSELSLTTCGDACIAAACTRAAALAVASIAPRVAADDEPAVLTFGTVLRGTDYDDDFVAETLSADEFVARWSSADYGTALSLPIVVTAMSGLPR